MLAFATVASALVGFGAIASPYALQAQALFIVFAATLALHGANRLFGQRWRAPGRGERALIMSGRAVGAMLVLSAPLAVMSFWTAQDLSAEKIGREIDRGVVTMSEQANAAYQTIAYRTPARDAADFDEH